MASNMINDPCAFGIACGKNVTVNGSTVQWRSIDSGGRLFIDKSLKSKDEIVLTFTGNGHADVGILTKDPKTLPNIENIENLKELTVIQVARIYKQTGTIKIKRCSDGEKIITESGDGTHTHTFSKSDKIWITLNILFGTLKVKIGPQNCRFYERRGKNIKVENNEAFLEFQNPSAVCYLENPLQPGETVTFQIEPTVKDGRPSRNFNVKMAVSEFSPESFLLSNSQYFDIDYMSVDHIECLPRKVQNNVQFDLTPSGSIRVQCEKGTFTKDHSTFRQAYCIFELSRVTLKCTDRKSYKSDVKETLTAKEKYSTQKDIADDYVSDSIYSNTKDELRLIREDAQSIISNEDNAPNESTNVSNIERGLVEKRVKDFSLQGLYEKFDKLSTRLTVVEKRVNTPSRDRSMRNSETRDLQSDIDDIKRMLERLTPHDFNKSYTQRETKNTGKDISFDKFVKDNYTFLVKMLEPKELLDHLFQNDKITQGDNETLRNKSNSDRAEANRDILDILMRRKNVDLEYFRKAIEDTRQDGILSKMKN